MISEPSHDVLISPASYWEIAIKVSLGKYQIPGSFQVWMDEQILVNHFEVLPITTAHAAQVSRLPFHHKAPFDRLLIAQALTEDVTLISVDQIFPRYSVTCLW